MHEAIAPGLQLGAQRYIRYAHEQRGQQRRDHQHAEQHIGTGPGRVLIVEAGGAEAFGKEQRTGRGQQGGDAVAGHIAGGQGGLAAVVGDFQAIGVDRDVLGGGSKGHHDGNGDQPGQVFLRVAEPHADQSEDHQRLCKHQPGATTSEFTEQWQAPLVEQRRPDPFEGIRQTDQARIADGLAGHTGLTQPHRKRREHQHVRQAGGKAEQQQH